LRVCCAPRALNHLAQAIAAGEEVAAADVSALSKRKLLTKAKRAFFGVAKGPDYAPAFAKQEAELTIAMLQSGDWKTAKLKAYVDPPPPPLSLTQKRRASPVCSEPPMFLLFLHGACAQLVRWYSPCSCGPVW